MNIRDARVVFWDFDGVIKESVAAKADAFHFLFLHHGREIADRVRAHHLANGGVSRFEKLPVYLEWVGIAATGRHVEDYARRFAEIVEEAVVSSEWVPGARETLEARREGQSFVLVSATPQQEIERILRRLGIAEAFARVIGAPTPKPAAIRQALEDFGTGANDALLIGDSPEDLAAANHCGVAFLLRRTPENRRTMPDYNGPEIEAFI